MKYTHCPSLAALLNGQHVGSVNGRRKSQTVRNDGPRERAPPHQRRRSKMQDQHKLRSVSTYCSLFESGVKMINVGYQFHPIQHAVAWLLYQSAIEDIYVRGSDESQRPRRWVEGGSQFGSHMQRCHFVIWYAKRYSVWFHLSW